MADAAGCFAGFVQFLLLNKNCTRAVDEFYLADKVSPPALSATHFALRQNATIVGVFGVAGCFACGKMLRGAGCLARRGVLLGRCGGRREMQRSAFKGRAVPDAFLPVGKMLRWSVCLARRFLCGKTLRGAGCLARRGVLLGAVRRTEGGATFSV